MQRKVSDEHFKAFHEIIPRYYNWDIILRDCGVTQVSDNGDQYEIPCPLHVDYTPSMRLNKDTGGYHCFSCGAKGSYVKFMWETSGRGMGYVQYCEQILKNNPSMQAQLGFSSLFSTEKNLDPAFNRRRVFDPKAHLGASLPLTSLASKVQELDDSWDGLALSLTLLQQGMSTDNVLAAVKRRVINIKGNSERVRVLDLINQSEAEY